MKKKSRSKSQLARRSRSALPGQYLVGAALLVGAGVATAAEVDNSVFEGGTNTYNNWIELSAGGLMPSGNKAQAEQDRHLSQGAFGGIEDLHFQQNVATNTLFTLDGRGIFDAHDYGVSLGLKKEDAYFLRFNFENFRTWYNADGGYYPPDNAWYPFPNGDNALALDRGEITFEAGLIPKDKPNVNFKYSHLYRDGEKSSTIWGQTHPLLIGPSRGLTPSFYDIDEKRDIFELDAKHHIKATDFGLGLRYEMGTFNNALNISQYPGEPPVLGVPQDRKITDRQGETYDLFNVHAFSETWIKPNLLFSSGFMYENLDTKLSGSRIYGDDFDVNYTPNPGNGAGYYDLTGGAQNNQYVLNLNLMATPLSHLTIVPSVRVQQADWDGNSSAFGTFDTAAPVPLPSESNGDALDVRERVDVRYTGITNWVLYAQGEWTEGQGNLEETGGMGLPTLSPPIQRATETDRFFQKYSAGVRWFPTRRISLDVGGYYKNNNYDYDNTVDSTANNFASPNRYPAYLVMQNFETYDGNTRLTLRPLANVTLVTRYEYQWSTIHTAPDPVSGLSEEESGQMTSQIIAQNISWSPWSRLYLQVGFNYVLSETKTPAADYTQAILNAQNNYWTVNFNSGLALDDKTDLNLGYTYYQADNYNDPNPVYLSYGAGAEEHAITATVVRRLTNNLRLTLRYGYYHYTDQTSGGNNDYDANVVYSSLQYRF
jgi:hypothetical protein